MWTLVAKRIRLSLRNGWLVAAWLITFCLALSILATSWVDYQERKSLFDAQQRGHVIRAEKANTYSQVSVGLERPPAILGLLGRGTGEELGSSAAIAGRFGATELTRRSRSTAALGERANTDLLYVLALVLGFLCVFFGHRVVNGERCDGTLKQTLARGVPRYQIVLGEFVGGLLVVVVPVILIFAIFVVWATLRGVGLRGEDWARLVALLLLVVGYAGAWLSLTLALSVLCRRAETALLLGLLFWVGAAGLYPSLAGWIAGARGPAEYPWSTQVASTSPLAAAGEGHSSQPYLGFEAESRNARIARHATFRKLALALPVTAFLDAGSLLATTSVIDHLDYLRAIERSEQELKQWQAEMAARYPDRVRQFVYGQPALDLTGLPEPVYRPRSLGNSLKAASAPIAVLALYLTLGLVVSTWGLETMDVR